VCREEDTRLVIGQDQVTSSVEVCEGDSWRRSLQTPLLIQTTNFAPRNVQVTTSLNGFTLSWEPSPPPSSSGIIRHEVTCTDHESRLTISMVASGSDASVSFLVRLSSATAVQCCVTAVIEKSGIGMLTAQSCKDRISFPNEVSSSSGSSQTLAFVNGGVAVALFLTLVVVASLLVGLILFHARSKKVDTVEEVEMSSGG